jgi:hypothetical protein
MADFTKTGLGTGDKPVPPSVFDYLDLGTQLSEPANSDIPNDTVAIYWRDGSLRAKPWDGDEVEIGSGGGGSGDGTDTRTDVSDGGTQVLSDTEDIDFGSVLDVTDDGDGSVSVDAQAGDDEWLSFGDGSDYRVRYDSSADEWVLQHQASGNELRFDSNGQIDVPAVSTSTLSLETGQSIEDGGGTGRVDFASNYTRINNDAGERVLQHPDTNNLIL